MLLLFDIDGTLMRGASAAHADALRRALKNVHDVDVERIRLTITAAGRTDGEIARLYLLEAGVSAERIDALRRRRPGGVLPPVRGALPH